MKVTWLGQAGLLFERDGFSVMIDPYLSDYVAKVEPQNVRRYPVDERFFDVDPDVMIFTHDHIDHYDPETAPVFFKKSKKRMSVLGPVSVRKKAMGDLCGQNYILFNRHTSVTLGGLVFTAVKASHSDPDAVGVVIEDTVEGKTYYVAGDTLYNSEIFGDLPEKIDVAFLPINGVGNNMNMTDAARLAARTGAKTVVPLHFGLFDALDARQFACENKVIPTPWKEIEV
jgi:L-ascorbate metabolism protein UlaG (beta-lactamase superfamily)